MTEKINFKTSYKEPILLFGGIFGIKILSAYEDMLGGKIFRKLIKKSALYRENKLLLGKAILVSMCLYDRSGEKVFSCVESALKRLTDHEINSICAKYLEISEKTIRYECKAKNIFENVKKHGYQHILQKRAENL